MIASVTIKIFALLCVFLLYGGLPSLQAEKHSLYYIYTSLSRPVDLPGIYEFTAMGLLDDRQMDYYNSKDQRKIPKQDWMKEKIQEDYREKGTQSRKSKEQWFNVNNKVLMNRMGHNESDLHVLQWRHGCEVEQAGEEVKFSKGITLPEVHLFTRKSNDDKSKLKLTCMATGFFPKDVHLTIRKTDKSLLDDEIESTGVRPNHDGSYQMRKSVEIKEEKKAE